MSFFSKANSFIKNGKIENSLIDMKTKIISNHGLPSFSTDVVNKTYCDQNTGSVIPASTFILISTNWTMVLPNEFGDFMISVRNVVDNGPCGKFLLTKNSAGRHPSIVRTNSVSGSVTNERLEIRWRLNSGIEIRKSGQNYDGIYQLKYTIN